MNIPQNGEASEAKSSDPSSSLVKARRIVSEKCSFRRAAVFRSLSFKASGIFAVMVFMSYQPYDPEIRRQSNFQSPFLKLHWCRCWKIWSESPRSDETSGAGFNFASADGKKSGRLLHRMSPRMWVFKLAQKLSATGINDKHSQLRIAGNKKNAAGAAFLGFAAGWGLPATDV